MRAISEIFKDRYRLGTYLWGTLYGVFILIGALFVCKNFTKAEIVAPVIIALIATMGIVWSWFFQLSQKDSHHKDIMALGRDKLSLSASKEVQ